MSLLLRPGFSTLRRYSSASQKFVGIIQQQIDEIKAAGTFKNERVITSPQNALIRVQNRPGEVLNFCANNYLGLSDHPEVKQAAIDAVKTHGAGLSSVRFICGTQDIHKDLEKKISQFHGTEDTILYIACFDANGGVFEGLLGDQDAIISDALNHASIIDGIRLAKSQRYRYKHLDMQDLEDKLKEADSKGARLKLIVTDGAFSMDGEIAPLDKIVNLAKKYDALTFIDECHATGFLGTTGRGTDEYWGVQGQIDIINSTLGKAMGGASGGYTTGRKEIVTLLRQRSRPYLFSNTLPPAVVGASSKAFDLVLSSTELRDRLTKNTQHFRSRMTKAGFKLKGFDHPIAPVMLGDARLASEMADDLLKRGIYVIGFSYPVVPKGEARIRVQLSAAHTPQQIDQAVDAFIEVGKKKGVIN